MNPFRTLYSKFHTAKWKCVDNNPYEPPGKKNVDYSSMKAASANLLIVAIHGREKSPSFVS
jgi:hypothetical protein